MPFPVAQRNNEAIIETATSLNDDYPAHNQPLNSVSQGLFLDLRACLQRYAIILYTCRYWKVQHKELNC